MFVYLFVVVVDDVVFWLRPLRVVPVGRGSFTSGRPAVATATKHSSKPFARLLAHSTRFTSSEKADRARLNPTHAPGGGGNANGRWWWRLISARQRREPREGGRGRGGVGEFAGQQDDHQTAGSFRSRAARQSRRPAGWGQLRPLGRASKAARWRTGGKIAGDTRGAKKGQKRAKKRARRRGCCFKL